MGQKKSFNTIDKILIILWVIGTIVATLLVIIIVKLGIHNIKDISPLIGAFAILISAGIASASVMKSIYATQQNEKQKAEKEKERKQLFALNVIKTIHIAVNAQRMDSNNNLQLLYINFTANMEIVRKLIDSIFCESILPFLSKDEESIIAKFYSDFNQYIFVTRLSHPNPEHLTEVASFIEIIEKYKKHFGSYAEKYIQLYELTEK